MEFFFDHYKAVRQFLFKSQKKNGTLHLGLIKHGGGEEKSTSAAFTEGPRQYSPMLFKYEKKKILLYNNIERLPTHYSI